MKSICKPFKRAFYSTKLWWTIILPEQRAALKQRNKAGKPTWLINAQNSSSFPFAVKEILKKHSKFPA